MLKSILKKITPKIIIKKTRVLRYFPHYIIGKYHKNFKKPIKIFNKYFFFPEDINTIELGRYFFNHYEKEEKYFIEKYIRDTDTILELGGNVGVISNLINGKLKIKENHIVFEPNPFLIDFLNKNKILNDSKYFVIQGVISKDKNIEFYLSKNILSSSTKVISKNKITPKSYSISEVENKHKTHFNVLVMDIEGAEIDLIRDFDLSKFEKLIIEFHPGKTKIEEIDFCKTNLINQGFVLVEKMKDVEFWKKN